MAFRWQADSCPRLKAGWDYVAFHLDLQCMSKSEMLAEITRSQSGTSPWGMSGTSPIRMVLYLFSTKGLLEVT